MKSPSRILIIEDEADIASTLEYALGEEGFVTGWCGRGDHGLAYLAGNDVDMIILDVGLPDGSGFELLKEIRSSEFKDNKDIPVMMLTARSDELDRIIGLEIGADDYVTKPFSPREVVARVKAILKRTRQMGHSAAAPLEHNPAAMLFHWQGARLDLTKSEYLLLCTLFNRPGQIFSRRQLIEKVWSDNHPSDDRAIDTHVKTLRAKLKQQNDSADPIQTHRGFGYSYAP